jgi:hypothetical protein
MKLNPSLLYQAPALTFISPMLGKAKIHSSVFNTLISA